ncbi:unnamed protein product [Parascedosporium putredinis]|uniref:Uncharacterized protein n=1 Tax=Parascedosporium putredinis TaxID=1442378 RepID=A0A9P1GWE2_9PEZI|nr:unnamed protein product [Parascedosporium putredinis]CAI7989447.1 unnamed protein product [Parascedosporium putredinis]
MGHNSASSDSNATEASVEFASIANANFELGGFHNLLDRQEPSTATSSACLCCQNVTATVPLLHRFPIPKTRRHVGAAHRRDLRMGFHCPDPGPSCPVRAHPPEDDGEDGLARRGPDDDVAQTHLTNPQTWAPSQFSWWKKVYNEVRWRGAAGGPVVKHREKLDPAINNYLYGSHAVFYTFDDKMEDDKPSPASKGLVGGVNPIWGCTGILIATDKGVYTAHIWEVPTFKGVGLEVQTQKEADLEWDLRSRDEGWITVHVWTPFDPYHTNQPRFRPQILALEKEIAGHLRISEASIQRHLYARKAPLDGFGERMDPHIYYSNNPGTALVVFQYAPEETKAGAGDTLPGDAANIAARPHPFEKPEDPKIPKTEIGDEKTPEPMRALRIWFDKKPVETKLWCIPGRNCHPICEAEHNVRDRAQAEAGPSGSGPALMERAGLFRRYDFRRIGFEGLFGDQLSMPGEGSASTRWWTAMSDMVKMFGAVGRPLGVQSTDHYAPDDAIFRPLGDEPVGGGFGPLSGCTGVFIATRRGVYVAHLWQRPNFVEARDELQRTFPDLYSDQDKVWKRRVTALFNEGTTPIVEWGTQGASLKKLVAEELKAPPEDSDDLFMAIIFTPDQAWSEVEAGQHNKPKHPAAVDRLRHELADILEIPADKVYVHTYFKREGQAAMGGQLTLTNEQYFAQNPGLSQLVWHYAPAQVPTLMTGRDTVRALRVYWNRKQFFYDECTSTSPIAAATNFPWKDPDFEFDCFSRTLPENNLARRAEGDYANDYEDCGIWRPYLSQPNLWAGGVDDWWIKMKELVDKKGAQQGIGYEIPDDYASDHSSLRVFGNYPLGSGITPMWGCTGIFVRQEHHQYEYDDEEALWERRVGRLLRTGIKPRRNDGVLPEIKPLKAYTESGQPFDPHLRRFLKVLLITPGAQTRIPSPMPRYKDKVDRLREELAALLHFDLDQIKTLTYMAAQYMAFREDMSNGMDAFFDRHPGVQLGAFQYAPTELSLRKSPEGVDNPAWSAPPASGGASTASAASSGARPCLAAIAAAKSSPAMASSVLGIPAGTLTWIGVAADRRRLCASACARDQRRPCRRAEWWWRPGHGAYAGAYACAKLLESRA